MRQKVLELMESHKNNGYVRVAGASVVAEGKLNYIPVFNVSNPLKPEKVRLVFDCAAQYQKTSLNSALLQGPDLTTP